MRRLSRRSETRRLVRKAAYILAVALLVAGVATPVIHRRAPAIDYLFIFDLSLSMATEDHTEGGLPTSRLDVAKDVFRRSLSGLPAGSQVSIAGFAGQSLQVFLLSEPVTRRDAIEDALAVLEWDNVWDVGSRIDRALWDVAVQMRGSRVFTTGGAQPILEVPLNVIVFTDGGGDDVRTRVGDDAAVWLRRNARITFLGLGRTTPSTVPEPTREGARDCLRTETGECLSSRLNEENLRNLAGHLEGRYERLETVEQVRAIVTENPMRGAETDVPVEVGWLFGLGSLAAFLAWRVL
jgi:hypothetical protein